MHGTQDQPSEYKTVPFFCIKTDEAQGIVDHIVTVYGIEDLGGDVSHPGSFTKTITERRDQIRVLDCHQRDSVMRVLGIPLDLREIGREELPKDLLVKYPDATGALRAKTQFLLDTPEGKGAFIRIKAGAVKEFSYAYDTLDEDYSTKDGHEVRNLRTVRLWEYGPVIFGMNPATEVLGVKDASVSMDAGGNAEKPAPDVTENTIRIRVKDPKTFQEGSFRTVNIGAKDNGISAVMARLKGETTMTVQSYVFDKEKWTPERAREWVAGHKNALVIVLEEKEVEPGGPDKCVCPKCGEKVDKERGVPCREMKCPKCGASLVADTDESEDGSTSSQEKQGSGVLDLITIAQAQIEIEFAKAEAGPAE